MLDLFIVLYVLANVFFIGMLAVNAGEIYDDIEEYGIKVKHLVTLILFPLPVILILLIVLILIIVSTATDLIPLSKIMNKTIWKSK